MSSIAAGGVQAPDGDEISIFNVANLLLRWRRTLLIFAVAGAVVGLLAGLLSKRNFVSTVSFIPQASASDATGGGLALAASQFGFRVPGGGSAWGPPIYVELLASRGLLEPIARDTIAVAELGGARMQVMDLLDVDKQYPPRERLERGVLALRLVASAAEDKKLGAVRIAVRTHWPSVSLALAQRLVQGVNDFNLKTRQSQASAERAFASAQARDAERALREAEDRMQSFLQSNRVVGSPELKFTSDRLQRDITLRQQAYTALLQSEAEARIREVRDTPVITVIEAPVAPALGESRQTLQKIIMGFIAGLVLGVVVAAYRSARASGNPASREFFDALDAATPRFLRPRRTS